MAKDTTTVLDEVIAIKKMHKIENKILENRD